MLFLNAIGDVIKDKEYKVVTPDLIKQVRKYLEVDDEVVERQDMKQAEWVRLLDASRIFLDQEQLFFLYTVRTLLPDEREDLKLKMKSENTVIKKWPMRVEYGCTDTQFDVTLWSAHTGEETYVEWCRA